MRAWVLATAALLAACGGPHATPASPTSSGRGSPAPSASASADAVSPKVVDPLAPLPPGAHARCGTARMRFVSRPEAVAIGNDGRILSIENIDGRLLLRDVVKGAVLRALPDADRTALAPDATRVLSIRRTEHKRRPVLVVAGTGGNELGRVALPLPKGAPPHFRELRADAAARHALAVAGTTVFAVSLDPPRFDGHWTLHGDSVEGLSDDGSRALVLMRPANRPHGLVGALASVHRHGVLALVDVSSGRTLRTLGTKAKPFEYSDVALSHDGRRIFIGELDRVDDLDARTGTLRTLARIPGHGLGGLSAGGHRLLVSPDDSRLVYRQRGVHLLDTASGSAKKLPDGARARGFSPDGSLLLYRDAAAAVVRGKHYDVPVGHRAAVRALAFLDGGRLLASAGRSLRMWDPRTGAPLGSTALAGRQVQLAAAPDGHRLAVATRDLEIARTATHELVRVGSLHHLSSLAFAPAGSLLVGTDMGSGRTLGARKKPLRLRPDRTLFRLASDGSTRASVDVGDVLALVAAPDSKHVAVSTRRFSYGRRRASVELRDTATLQQSVSLVPLESYGDALAFAGPDTLIAASTKHGAVAFELASRSITRRFELGGCCGAIAVSPDGSLLAAAAGGDVQLWELATRRLRGIFRGHTGAVTALSFSPDGKWLASAGRDTSVLVWDTRKAPPVALPTPRLEKPRAGSLSQLARGHKGEQLAVLSKGRLVASGDTLPKLPPGLVAVARGAAASCAITAAHRVACWGRWLGPMLGPRARSHARSRPNAHATPHVGPTKLQPVPGVRDARHIAVGLMYACATDPRGAATCWGSLGGVIERQPPSALKVSSPIRDIQIGLAHACALLQSGHVLCWGDNPDGQLGTSATSARSPTVVPGLSDAVGIGVGDLFSCALRRTGAVLCWGDNSSDQLGDGTGVDSDKPVAVRGVQGARALSAGGTTACAVAAGQVKCWGRLAGYRGTEVHFTRATPVSALGKASAVRVVAGHVCVQGGGPLRCARFQRR